MPRTVLAFVVPAIVALVASLTGGGRAENEPAKRPLSAMTQSEATRVAGLEFVARIEQRIAFTGSARDVAMELLVKNVSDQAISISVNDAVSVSLFNTAEGVRLNPNIGRNGTPRAKPPVKLAPGESWTWNAHAQLGESSDPGALRLAGPDAAGTAGAWFFTKLMPGKYRLSISYVNSTATQDGAELWVGKATTKEAEFEIIRERAAITVGMKSAPSQLTPGSPAKVKGTDPAANAAATTWGAEVKGLQAQVTLDKKRFTVGEPIVVDYKVKNISNVELTIWHSGFWPNHLLLVRDFAGKEPTLTAAGRAGRRAFSPGGQRDKNVSRQLKPGEVDDTEGRYDLTALYDLLAPGRYRVQCVYEERQGGWEGRLESNAADFEIVSSNDARRTTAVEKDGLRFEAVVPDQAWKVPENRPGNSAPISVSLRITNRTDKPHRFAGYDTLSVKLSDAEGREAARWPGPYVSLRHRRPAEGDFPLVAPGQSVSFPSRLELFWPTLDNRTLWLRTWNASGSPRLFYERLTPGAYKLTIVYECQPTSYFDYPDHTSSDNQAWTGTIETTAVGVEIQARPADAASRERP